MKNTNVDIIVRVILLILFLIAVFLFKEQTYAGRFVSLVFQSITVVAIFAYMLIVRPRILKDEKNLEIATQPQKAPIGIRLLKLSVIFFIVGILFALGSFVLLFFDPSLYSSIIKTFGTKSHGFDSSCMGLIVPEINLNSRSYPPEMTVYCLDFVKIFIVMIAVTLAIFIMYEFRNKPRVIATVFLLVMAAYFAWSFLGILLNPPATAPSCKLPTGFVCVNYTLHRTGELDFDVGQGTGHSVKITGFTCAQNYSQDYQYTADINNYADDPITIPSKGHTFISKAGTSHVVRCTDAEGKNVSSALPALHITKIYINYTEIDTGMSRIAVGDLTAKFE